MQQLDPQAEMLMVRDPDGNAVHLHGRVSRSGEHGADPGRRPVRIQHVTLATTNIEPMIDFYLALGFRLTDRMGGVFAWLRSNVEHHSVAIVDTGASGGLDHYSFDLDSWDDFKIWADRLTDRGIQVQWGPGRHGPGNNLFLFFDDLDGNHIELSAEMERFFDGSADYTPRIWNADPSTVNLWGGQVPSWRNARETGGIMRFASCTHAGRTFAAALVDGAAVPLAGIPELGAQTPSSVLADPPLDRAGAVPLAEVTLRPVVPRPSKIVCVGLNYLNHVGETGREIPEYPVLFTKFAETLTGPTDPIALPPESSQVDYEGELAVVIGRPGRRIAADAALAHVAGYTIANDVTMRDFQYKTHQWLQGKAMGGLDPGRAVARHTRRDG